MIADPVTFSDFLTQTPPGPRAYRSATNVAEVAQGAIGHTHQIKCSSVAKEDENDVGWI